MPQATLRTSRRMPRRRSRGRRRTASSPRSAGSTRSTSRWAVVRRRTSPRCPASRPRTRTSTRPTRSSACRSRRARSRLGRVSRPRLPQSRPVVGRSTCDHAKTSASGANATKSVAAMTRMRSDHRERGIASQRPAVCFMSRTSGQSPRVLPRSARAKARRGAPGRHRRRAREALPWSVAHPTKTEELRRPANFVHRPVARLPNVV